MKNYFEIYIIQELTRDIADLDYSLNTITDYHGEPFMSFSGMLQAGDSQMKTSHLLDVIKATI